MHEIRKGFMQSMVARAFFRLPTLLCEQVLHANFPEKGALAQRKLTYTVLQSSASKQP